MLSTKIDKQLNSECFFVALGFHLFHGIFPFMIEQGTHQFRPECLFAGLVCTQCNKMSACKKWTFDRIAKVINIKNVNEEPSVDLQIEMLLIFFHFPYFFVTLVPQSAYCLQHLCKKRRKDWANVLVLLLLLEWMNRPSDRPTDQLNRKTMNRTHRFGVCVRLYVGMLNAQCRKYSNLKGAFREVKCIPNSMNSY